jgi:hypothetical protein
MEALPHLLKSYDLGDALDDIASADPPAYLRRCFAEGLSAPDLSLARVQQLAVCGMVLDSLLHERDYAGFEPELMADWRTHYGTAVAPLKPTAVAALKRAADGMRHQDPDAATELDELEQRLAAG